MDQIEFKNVTKEYDTGTIALNQVSFSIRDGEFVFIIGPSGAGKSTLVKMLIREETPSSGEIFVEGEEIGSIPQDEIFRLRRKIGVVFQDFKLLNSKNIFDNIAVALEVVNAPKEVIANVVPNVLGLVGLSDKMYYMPNQLSGGEKQRVSIARALAHEPDILIADEPTGMIDPKSAAGIIEVLEKINSLGTTVLMATHNSDIVNRLKKRVIKIENGVLVTDKKEGGYHE